MSELIVTQDIIPLPTEGINRYTAQKLKSMTELVKELSKHEMGGDDIQALLKFSASGTRKYVRELRNAGVIELARYVDGTATYLGKPVYQLTADPELVSGFLAAIIEPKTPVDTAKRYEAQLDKTIAQDPSRRFHIMSDDTPYAIRVSRAPVARDPLVAALFGAAAGRELAHA